MASNPNQAIFDAETRHAIYLERFGGGVARRMVRLLLAAEKDIIGKLKDLPDGPTKTQQAALLKTVRARISDLAADFRDDLTKELLELAAYEAGFTRDMFAEAYAGRDAAFQRVPLEAVRAAAMSRPFQGIHLRWARPEEHASELVLRNFRAAQGEIERGFIEGESISAITARIRPLIEVKAARDVETIAITAVKHIGSVARQEFHRLNPGVVAQERWNAVLDGRTSEVCRSRDGKMFEVGKGPQPPAHPRCRSTRVGIGSDYPPPTKRTYDQWLRTQSAEVQDEILGKGKAELFRDGLTLDRFFDERRGREYTLAELREMDARR
jgi:SPP1 gp7 family putative phage head morphogenesis protein